MKAKTIAEHRTALKMSQRDLARKTGMTQGAVCLYENSKRIPTLRNVKRIANALNVGIADISIADRLAC
jgi:transcriptional regulator with XRE-family HTH domain